MTKKRKPRGTVLERIEARKKTQAEDRAALIKKVEDARWTAYFDQEHRTSDPVVKKAVADATLQMMCLILDLPYDPRPNTLRDVGRMVDGTEALSQEKKGETPSA